MTEHNDNRIKSHPSAPSVDGIYWVADTATNELMVGWIQTIPGCTEPVRIPLEFEKQQHIYLQYMNVIPHPHWNGKLLDEFRAHPDSETMVWVPMRVPEFSELTGGVQASVISPGPPPRSGPLRMI